MAVERLSAFNALAYVHAEPRAWQLQAMLSSSHEACAWLRDIISSEFQLRNCRGRCSRQGTVMSENNLLPARVGSAIGRQFGVGWFRYQTNSFGGAS